MKIYQLHKLTWPPRKIQWISPPQWLLILRMRWMISCRGVGCVFKKHLSSYKIIYHLHCFAIEHQELRIGTFVRDVFLFKDYKIRGSIASNEWCISRLFWIHYIYINIQFLYPVWRCPHRSFLLPRYANHILSHTLNADSSGSARCQ